MVVAGCPRKWRNFELELEIILFIFHGGVRGLSDSAATRERREEEGDGGGGFSFFFLNFFLIIQRRRWRLKSSLLWPLRYTRETEESAWTSEGGRGMCDVFVWLLGKLEGKLINCFKGLK